MVYHDYIVIHRTSRTSFQFLKTATAGGFCNFVEQFSINRGAHCQLSFVHEFFSSKFLYKVTKQERKKGKPQVTLILALFFFFLSFGSSFLPLPPFLSFASSFLCQKEAVMSAQVRLMPHFGIHASKSSIKGSSLLVWCCFLKNIAYVAVSCVLKCWICIFDCLKVKKIKVEDIWNLPSKRIILELFKLPSQKQKSFSLAGCSTRWSFCSVFPSNLGGMCFLCMVIKL